MKKVLFDGESVRPAMYTRMPQFGEANLRHLPDLFARLDKVEPYVFKMPNGESGDKKERDREKELRTLGESCLATRASAASLATTSTARRRRPTAPS